VQLVVVFVAGQRGQSSKFSPNPLAVSWMGGRGAEKVIGEQGWSNSGGDGEEAEEDEEVNQHSAHLRSHPTFQPRLRLWS